MKGLFFTLLVIGLFNNVVMSEEIAITSNPEEVDIFVKNAQTGQELKIGKTPYKGDVDALTANVANGSVFMIELRKVGFESYRILFTKAGKSDIAVNVNMEVAKDMSMTQDFDLLTGDLFDVQRMVRTKDYQSALKKLEMLEKKFPHFSVVYEMRASVFYLMKEFKRSLTFYRKAFATNPKNRDAYRMKMYLEKKFKVASNVPR
ncbi:MAG: hypothetical protein KC493_05335 [Bacteriovoracaceae bacterium]|nr:hypothetical protein [Bacteriovoracaceae bacterium]